MSVVFWKSYSTQKCIWPTFSLGSELSIYISIIDALRFCWCVCAWLCDDLNGQIWKRNGEKEREKKEENDRFDQRWTDVSMEATINHILVVDVV